jgi:hypothetical protein
MPAASAAAKPQKRAVARITWLVRMEILEEGTTTFAERQAQPTSSSSQRSSRAALGRSIATIRRWGGMFNRLGRLRFRACNGAKELSRASTRSGACSHAMPKLLCDIIRILLHATSFASSAHASIDICIALGVICRGGEDTERNRQVHYSRNHSWTLSPITGAGTPRRACSSRKPPPNNQDDNRQNGGAKQFDSASHKGRQFWRRSYRRQ